MSYPVTLQVETPDPIARWRPLLQWFFAIPHLFIAQVLEAVSHMLALISLVVIVITAKLPAGFADLQVMILRYKYRYLTYAMFLHDRYPPLMLDPTSSEPEETPTTLDITPALEDRSRPTILFRFILIIPALAFAGLIGIVASACLLLGFFAVLFLGRWPAALRDWVVLGHVITVRVNAYWLFLTDEYPPFLTDEFRSVLSE